MWPSTWRAPIGFRLMCCRNRRPWNTFRNCWPLARKPTWTHSVSGAVACTNRMNSIRFGVPEMDGRFLKCGWMAFDSDGRPIGHHDMARLSIRLFNVSDQFLVPGHRFSGSHAERPPLTVSPVHHLVGWKSWKWGRPTRQLVHCPSLNPRFSVIKSFPGQVRHSWQFQLVPARLRQTVRWHHSAYCATGRSASAVRRFQPFQRPAIRRRRPHRSESLQWFTRRQ